MVVQLSHSALLCCIKKMPHNKDFKVLARARWGGCSPWQAVQGVCVHPYPGAVRRVNWGFQMADP